MPGEAGYFTIDGIDKNHMFFALAQQTTSIFLQMPDQFSLFHG